MPTRRCASPGNHSSSFTTPVNAWFGCEELDPDALLLDFARVTIRQLLGSRRHEDHSAIGFKEIRWLQRELGGTTLWSYLEFIQSLFVNSRFILLTRNVDELLQSGWWPVMATDATRRDIEQFYSLARTAPVRSLFEIDYADLREGSDAVRRLADFVDSQYRPEIDQVFATRHSYDMSESKLRELEIARLRAMIDAERVGPSVGWIVADWGLRRDLACRLPNFPFIKHSAISARAVDDVLHVRDVPPPAARRANAAVVQRLRDAAKVRDARCPDRVDDGQDVGGELVGFGHLNRPAGGGRLDAFRGLPSLAPCAFRAASADRVRSPISRRSFSASAA